VVADFIPVENIDATVMPSDFDVSIAGSVPLVGNFNDVDPTLASIETAGYCLKILMCFDLNPHVPMPDR
jgi:hypothetical protein